ncbi:MULTISPECIES: helix-turn-helix transcriptional regulator [unclassified Staphylococcus]|uniref:helix-turn-helix transcriptional regulator n=1 Tax=unclassified Staphylococcus TaxID=91994 RepID=UPI0021CF5CB4|nr:MULTISPECIES: helix-turn-helix transcriptional regulator [unclassified Staphylococcus]UXR78165.1 helix-turn-helix domain-containing protein [Staphylococcus sp. IVB6227]UXR82328.1 helix-turn-helix domain-containing protein [Staphylococcus sp. IVB6214]
MFPKVYHLTEPMIEPVRCFDGLVLVWPVDKHTTIKIEGRTLNNQPLYLINESDLYEIHSHSAVLFYLSSNLFNTYDTNIFKQDFIIQQYDIIKSDLSLLFKLHLTNQQQTEQAHNVIQHLVKELTRLKYVRKPSSDDMFQQIIHYIRTYIHERITLEKLSKHFHVSISYISTLCKQNLNINFYDYTSSLRIAKTLENVSIHDDKIKTIADQWLYPSATNYIIHFKKYLGMTPKKYKSLPVANKALHIPNLVSDPSQLALLTPALIEAEQKTTVFLSDRAIKETPFSFFNLVDIGPFANIDTIISEPNFFYKNFSTCKLASYIYINEPIENVITENTHETIVKLRKLFQVKIPIAMRLTDIKSYHFILQALEDLYYLESEYLPMPSIHDEKILLLLDLNNINIHDIHHIQRHVYGIHIEVALDMTDYYLSSQSIGEEIRAINPDFYIIDFQKIKNHYPSSPKSHHSKKIQYSLCRFLKENIDANKTIFLNYDTFYKPEIMRHTSLFLEEILKCRGYIAGASISFTQKKVSNPTVSLFDSIENKTTFYFLGMMLLNFSKYPCHYGKNFVITRTLHNYHILLYNTNTSVQNFHITLQDVSMPTTMLVSSEVLNHQHGTAESMIAPGIKDKRRFPSSLKFKLNQYNTPLFNVDEHDFEEGAYTVQLPPQSVAMITLYH